ncbi:MAG TPA: lytic transglycosylase domain-containing protein, partial [Pyrinomonadaceae bacterium]|nr:lytic transglycosylase domain-containing protein [Pyrinomonadaceae bacterium]
YYRIFFVGIVLSLSGSVLMAQSAKTDQDRSVEAEQKTQVRLKLKDGTYLNVDDAWESPQGIWYRQGSLSYLASKDRVKSIDRVGPSTNDSSDDNTATVPQPVIAEVSDTEKPAWIYLKGGAKVEADSASESAAGVWYKRGPLSLFIERARLDHIERETAAVAAGPKERGWSTGSQSLDRIIKQNGSRYGVDPYLVFLVMEQESHFNTRAVSPKGARGLMQLMPGTSARFGVRRPHDAAQNVSGGTRYLKELLNRFNNRVDLVLASYNAGEGAVIKFGHRVPPYRETRNYVKKISFRYNRGKDKAKPATQATSKNNSTGEQ